MTAHLFSIMSSQSIFPLMRDIRQFELPRVTFEKTGNYEIKTSLVKNNVNSYLIRK